MTATVMREVCLCDLVEQAIEELPRFRRRVTEFRMSRPRVREAFYPELILALVESDLPATTRTLFAGETFDETTRFTIDVDRIREILDLVLEYLPQILALILTLFG